MQSVQSVSSGSSDVERDFERGGDDLAILAPLIAGARARGIADAFEMMGTAAILLDQFGMVLHAGAAASRLMDDHIGIASRHLVAGTACVNRALERLVEAAVSECGAIEEIRLPRDGKSDLRITAKRLARAHGDAAQLLKAVLLLSET